MKNFLLGILLLGFFISNAQFTVNNIDPISDNYPNAIDFINTQGDYVVVYSNKVRLYNKKGVVVNELKEKNIHTISYDSSSTFLTLNSNKNVMSQKITSYEATTVSRNNLFEHKMGLSSFIIDNNLRMLIKGNSETKAVEGMLDSKPKKVHISEKLAVIITKSNQIYFINLASRSIIKAVHQNENIISSSINKYSNTLVVFGKKYFNIFNIETGTNLQKSRVLSEGNVTASAVSSDNKYITYGDEYGHIWVSELLNTRVIKHQSKMKTQVTHISYKPNSYEYYVCQDFNKKALGFKIKAEKVKREDPFKTLVSADNMNKFNKDEFAPQIYIANLNNAASNNIRTKSNLYKVDGRVFDESGVHELIISGTEVPFKEDGKFQMMVPLSPGKNLVSVDVTDTKNNKATKEFNVTLMDKNQLAYLSSQARNFLLCIGINEYESFSKLNNAVNDAKAIQETLTTKYNIDKNNVYSLYDKEATLENIIAKFRKISKEISPNDNLIIYFAGHGIYDNALGEGYWIPVDAKNGKFSTYYGNSALLKVVNGLPAQHILLLSDACFSGSLLASSKHRGYLEQAEQYKSRRVITSGRLEFVSDGEASKHSPFSATLLKYFNTNQDDKISISVLELYLKQNFPEDTDQTPRFGTLPGAGDEGGEYIIPKRK